MSARWPAGEPGQAAGQGHRLGFLGCFPRSTGQRTSPTRRLAPAVALDWYMEEGRRQEPNTLHGSRSFRPKTPSAWFLWTLPTGKAAPRTGHPTPGTVSRPSDQGHLGPFPWMLPPWSCPGTPWTPTPPVPTGTSCSSPVGNFAPRSTLPAPSWRILLAPREGLRARRTPPVLVGTSWPAPRWEPSAPRRTARSLGPASSA